MYIYFFLGRNSRSTLSLLTLLVEPGGRPLLFGTVSLLVDSVDCRMLFTVSESGIVYVLASQTSRDSTESQFLVIEINFNIIMLVRKKKN